MFQVDVILSAAITRGASDIHLNVGKEVCYRVHGSLEPVGNRVPLTAEHIMQVMKSITPEGRQLELDENGSTDFGFRFKTSDGAKSASFRVNVCKSGGSLAIVLRRLPSTLLTPEQIGLPKVFVDLIRRPNGLILVTGPTGSGKSTTLAGLINTIAKEEKRHIITIEHPTEYFHCHHQSVITQREVPDDVPSFQKGLEDALRQDPNVIMVGEMRDLETMRVALRAADTGHLVFSTVHTRSAGETVNRLIDQFSEGDKPQVRQQLSTCLLAVLAQQLVPRADGLGRVAAFELLIATPAVQNHIRTGQVHKIDSELQTGSKFGMFLMEAHLEKLVRSGLVKAEDALAKAARPDDLLRRLNVG